MPTHDMVHVRDVIAPIVSIIVIISKTGKLTTFSPSCHLCLTLVLGAGASDCPCGVAPVEDEPLWRSPLQKPSGDWDTLEPVLPSRVPPASHG